jgi:hypothetical protein
LVSLPHVSDCDMRVVHISQRMVDGSRLTLRTSCPVGLPCCLCWGCWRSRRGEVLDDLHREDGPEYLGNSSPLYTDQRSHARVSGSL